MSAEAPLFRAEPAVPIWPLQGRFSGTWHVIGSGSQLDDLDPRAFTGQTITMNSVPLFWGLCPTFALTKYHDNAKELIAAGHCVVASRGDTCLVNQGTPPPGTAFVYDHPPMPHGWDYELADIWPTNSSELMVGPTVAMTALHFAAYLGAERIILLGCGGHDYVTGYKDHLPLGLYKDTIDWLNGIRPLVRAVADELERRYPVTIEGIPNA